MQRIESSSYQVPPSSPVREQGTVRWPAGGGNLWNLVELLEAQARMVESVRKNNDSLILDAIDEGEEIVLQLLKNPHINLAAMDHRLIRSACNLGWSRVLCVLLEKLQLDSKISSIEFRNELFYAATINGQAEIVGILLPSIDPTFDENKALIYAGNGEVARLLLEDGRSDPNAVRHNCFPLLMAAAHGKMDVVEALLRDPRTDPGLGMGAAAVYAKARGHEDIVTLLLSDRRVNPSGYANYEDWFRDPARMIDLEIDVQLAAQLSSATFGG